MESKWGIPNPASSASTGGNMAFPWMAAATIGSAGLNLGQRGAASSQAAAGNQAMKFKRACLEPNKKLVLIN